MMTIMPVVMITICSRSFSLLNLEQNTSYSFLMSCSDRQDHLWTSGNISFDTGVVATINLWSWENITLIQAPTLKGKEKQLKNFQGWWSRVWTQSSGRFSVLGGKKLNLQTETSVQSMKNHFYLIISIIGYDMTSWQKLRCEHRFKIRWWWNIPLNKIFSYHITLPSLVLEALQFGRKNLKEWNYLTAL